MAGLGQIRDYDNEPRGAVWWPAVTRTAKDLTVPYSSVNPATGEVLKTFTEHTDQEVMAALATADKAFVAWAARPIDERAKIIARAAQLLLEQKGELARLATLRSPLNSPRSLSIRSPAPVARSQETAACSMRNSLARRRAMKRRKSRNATLTCTSVRTGRVKWVWSTRRGHPMSPSSIRLKK